MGESFKLCFALAVTFMCSATGLVYSSQVTVNSILRDLQQSYEKVTTLQADFSQSYAVDDNKVGKKMTKKTTQGTVFIQRPHKMKWDYHQPAGQMLLVDNNTMTLFDPQLNQAMITKRLSAEQFPVGVGLLFADQGLDKLFDISLVSQSVVIGQSQAVLGLKPKRPLANVAYVLVTVHLSEPISIVKTVVEDDFGGENQISFSNLQRNPRLKASLFKFKPGKDTQVVVQDGARFGLGQ